MRHGLLATLMMMVCWWLMAGPAIGQVDEALTEVSQLMIQATENYAGINNYVSKVELQERHDGKIKGTENIKVVFRKSPIKLYCQWLEGSLYEGLRVSYVADRDGPDHVMARESGLAGLAGTSRVHMEGTLIRNFYPHHFRVSQYHIGFMIDHIKEVHRKARAIGQLKITTAGVSTSHIPGKRLRLYRIDLSPNPADGLPYRRSLLGFDEKTSLPLFVETYDFQDRLYASYKFIDFQPNVRLDDAIFDLDG